MNHNIRYTSVNGGRTVLVEQIKLTVILVLIGCLLLALETTALSRIRLPIGHMGAAAPSLGILFCMAVGFLHGDRAGGIAGLLTGWLADCTGRGGMMLLPLLYFFCGYLSGSIGKRRLAHNLPSFMVFSLIGGGIECLYSIGRAALFVKGMPPVAWILRGLVPVWILTVMFSPLVYGILWGERKLLNRQRK